MKPIYLDHAAGTVIHPEVQEIISQEIIGNPSSIHDAGLKAKELLEKSREKVKNIINAQKPSEIIFTASGTESINLAIQGIARANTRKGNHIITSKIEHDAVLETCRYLEKEEGFTVTYLNVDTDGFVNPLDVEKAITSKTILITIMYANNEIGTIQDIAAIGKIARKNNIYFHTDACQAGSILDIDVTTLNVDLMTLNGNKISGPSGVGLLYIKDGVTIHPLLHGGKQEFGLRSGTENVAAIAGFAKALQLAQLEKETENQRLEKLQQKLISGLIKKIPGCSLNGHSKKRLPQNVNMTFPGVDAEQVIRHLNQESIYVSSGSACTARSVKLSHVLEAMGIVTTGAIRFTVGRETKEDDVDAVLQILPPIIQTLREVSQIVI
ncbi:MAG: cysteine desulfurase family protein [Nanoarchaeota archaeon]|nr:cysteine desulfurase family protein [Nanoarchaeota archaeon]